MFGDNGGILANTGNNASLPVSFIIVILFEIDIIELLHLNCSYFCSYFYYDICNST